MTAKRFRKGELKFFLGCLPKEINDYYTRNSSDREYIKLFVEKYRYDYVKNRWIKNR